MSTHSTGQKTDYKTDQTKAASEYRSAAAIPLPTKHADPSKVDPAKVNPESKHLQSGEANKGGSMKGGGFGQKH
jgi:hypothetical protein